LTARERVKSSLAHQEPDRVPRDLGSTPVTSITKVAYENLRRHLGMKEEKVIIADQIQQLPRIDEKLLDRLGIDTRAVSSSPPSNWELKIKEEGDYYFFTDEWGIIQRMPKAGGLYFDMAYHPLAEASKEDLKRYSWPDPENTARYSNLKDKISFLYNETDYALVGLQPLGAGIFEQAWWLRGMEKFMMDMLLDKKFAEILLDKILEIYLSAWDKFLNLAGKYVQVVTVYDDLCSQEGPLISPSLYRELIKPREKELISAIKQKTEAKVFFHSCGAVWTFIPDLIDIGVDILNPVQVSAKDMDTKRLKREFGKDITFWGGGCDTQNILPHAKPEDVKREARRRLEDLAPGGGFVFNSVHNIQNDVPPENIAAMFETAEEYGKY